MTPNHPPARSLRYLPPLLAALAAVLIAGVHTFPVPDRAADRHAVWTVERAADGREAVVHAADRRDGWTVERPADRRDGWTAERDGQCRDPRESDCAEVPSPFLLTRTDARVVVTGPVAHTVLRQEWRNPNRDPLEATYIFPLPENAAVTALKLSIGTRTIEAEMRRREEAKAIYERARAEGKVAALLDQERPNVFAQRVANIMPGERIEVAIEFDQEIRCDDGDCAYVLPTVVGPRFVPARTGDPGRIDPPVALPGTETGHRLTFDLDLDAGMPYHDLRTPGLRMDIETSRSGRARLRLGGEEGIRLDRDVQVRWRLGGRDPEFGVLAWRDADQPGTFTMMLQPPVGADADAAAEPRELTFILDCSGSMSGLPIEAAKNVVRLALKAARPSDTLQILRFSERASGLWSSPVPATSSNVRRALEYLDTLHGEGGTEMLSGIRAALEPPADPERLRMVALLTDGYIGNEVEILGEVRRLIGQGRLFSFGIGSSVNRYLLETIAQEGRGAAAFIGPRESPEAFVNRFVARIATPVFTDLRLSWEGIEVDDLEPPRVPDLFAGQPLVIHGRYRTPGAGTLVLEGRLRGRREVLRRTVTLPNRAADHEALGRLWARARIERLTRESYGQPDRAVVASVTDLGLRFRLMTPWTSLVAVDQWVSNRGGATQSVDVPVELPEGVSPAAIPGPQVFGARQASGGPQVGNGFVERLRSLGYVGDASKKAYEEIGSAPPAAIAPPPSGRRSSEVKEKSAPLPRPVPDLIDGHEATSVSFILVRVVEEDGTQRTVEADGEAWIARARSRSLVRTLTSEQFRALEAALQTAGVERWPEGDATYARGRARLVVVLPDGSTRSLPLPAADARVQAIVALVQAATLEAAMVPGR